MEDSRYRPPDVDLPQVRPPEQYASSQAGPEVPFVPQQKVGESELAAEAIKKQPVRAFEQAASAADQDKPLEKIHELRHEIKDQFGSTATPIGQVVAGMPQRQPGLAQFSSPPPVEPPIQQVMPQYEPIQLPAQPSLYRRAVRGGFYVGLLLTGLYILIALLF